MGFSIQDIKIPLGELYDAVVTDHSSRPRNFGLLPDATVTMSGDNPSCGDEISLSLRIDPAADRVVDVGFKGHGCMVCMASTSMMTIKVKGKTRAEVDVLLSDFQSMITGKTPADEASKNLGDLCVLSGVSKYPQRIKCATLSWHALKGALAESNPGGSFSLDNNDGSNF